MSLFEVGIYDGLWQLRNRFAETARGDVIKSYESIASVTRSFVTSIGD